MQLNKFSIFIFKRKEGHMIGNIVTIELRLSSDPEVSQHAQDLVTCNAFMTQGKKEDGKKPMFFQLNAWKYSGKVLINMQKNKLYMATGRFNMDYWGNEQENSKLVFTAEDFGEKLFAPQNQQNNQQGFQNQGFQGGQG
jgi:single-stranded DNA-binding protein